MFLLGGSGWPHSSQNEIPCVFSVLHKFSLCYFYAKTISSMNKDHFTTVLLHTNSFFKVCIIWLVSIVNFNKCLLIEGSRESCDPCNDQGFRTPMIWYVKIILCWAHFADILKYIFLKWMYVVKTILWNWMFFKKWIYVVKSNYRSGTVNSNTVNSKFHLIRSFSQIFARFLSFHV